MNERESIDIIYMLAMDRATDGDEVTCEALDMAMKALEKQEKLKEWIDGYKGRELFMIEKDELVSILKEFVVEELYEV